MGEIMKTNFVRASLACAALALSSTAAMAAIDPIPGVDIIVQKNPGGTIVHIQTDANGTLTLRNLAPGDYVIEIGGKSLVAAMDKLAPAAPEKQESHSSFSLGIGGFLGGGSSHSSGDHGGGPVGGGSHGSSHSSGGGGMGVGLSVPLGGGDDKGSAQPGEPITSINISLPNKQDMKIDAPYCRDAASRGMRIGFTVPAAGDWVPVPGDYDGVGMTVKISESQSPLPQDR